MTTAVGHDYYMCFGSWSNGYETEYINISIGERCGGDPMDPWTPAEVYGTGCQDNVDNDEDGHLDCYDPDCWWSYC